MVRVRRQAKQAGTENETMNVTFDICTPRLLWIPEHCMHMKIPKFTLAHRGPLHAKQSNITS